MGDPGTNERWGGKQQRERGEEKTKPTPKPQEAALTNGAVPQPYQHCAVIRPIFH